MMRRSREPMERAAFTNSSSRMRMNSARARRATPVQVTTPMAMATVGSVGSKSATSTMASSSGGSTWKNSVIRISTSSTQPR